MTASTLPLIEPSTKPAIRRNHLSYSSISTYQACPLRYYFRYVQQLPEPTVSASLVFGSAIHSALEFHYRELLAGEPAPDLDTMLNVYQEAWQARKDDNIDFGKNETVDALGILAESIFLQFKKSELAQPEGRILGIEEELRGQLVPGCPDLLARVDLILEADEEVVVTDFKTSRSRWSQGNLDASSGQLLLYHELARPLAGNKPLRLEFLVVTKTKQPAIERHTVEVSPLRIARIRRMVERVWASIAAGNFYPAPSPTSCPSCPFREPCGQWTG